MSLFTSTTMIMNLESSLGLKNMLVKSYEFSGRSSALPKKSRGGGATFSKKLDEILKNQFFIHHENSKILQKSVRKYFKVL